MSRARSCATCGAPNVADARHCATCGIALTDGETVNPDLAALVDDTRPAPHTTPEVGPTAVGPAAVDHRPASEPTAAGFVAVRPTPAPTDPRSPRRWIGPVAAGLAVGTLFAVIVAVVLGGVDEPGADAPETTGMTAMPVTVVETTAPPVVATTAPPVVDAAAELAAVAAGDFDRALELRERWVPQLSAKRDGTTWEGVTYDLVAILEQHRELDERVAGALLVEGSSLAFLSDGERMADWWFTLADVDDATGTLRLRPT